MTSGAADPGLLRNPRAWLLAVLTVAVVAFQTLLTFQILVDPHCSERWGFEANTVDGVLTVTSVPPGDDARASSAAFRSGLQKSDRILAIRQTGLEFHHLGGLFDSAASLRALRSDLGCTLLVQRGESVSAQDLEVTLPPASPRAAPDGPSIRLVVSKIFFPTLCIVVAILVGFLRLHDRNAFLASLLLFSFAGASWSGGSYAAFPPGAREAGLLLYVALFSSWSYFFARFFVLFPNPSRVERSAPWLKRVLAAFPILFTAWNANWAFTEALSWERYTLLMARWGTLDRFLDIGFLLLFVLGFVSLFLNLSERTSKTDRRRLELLLLGSLGILPALVLYFRSAVLWSPPAPNWMHAIAGGGLALFPALFAYAVIKHRIFGIRPILRRGLQFAFLSKGFMFLEGTLVFLALFYFAAPVLGVLLHGAGAGTVALVTALATMVAILALRQINRRVMHGIERRFFRENYDGRRILMDLSGAVRRLSTRPQVLLRLVTIKILDSLHPEQVAVFIRGSELVRLPLLGEESDGTLVSRAQRNPNDFLCVCQQAVPGPLSTAGGVSPAALAFPGKSLTVTQLETMAASDTGVSELDLEDSRSWAAALRRAHHNDSQPQVELALLVRYGVRLLIPLVSNGRLLGFITLGEKQSEEPYSGEDKDLLLSVGHQVALALEHSEFLKEEAEEIHLKRDLEIAQKVQERLFPQTMPPVPGLQYSGVCKPARGVGGDYYDFLDLGPGRLGLALGDVTGKGISAALLMACLQAMLRIHSDEHRDDPERLTADINRHMCQAMEPERFASFFYGVFDTRSRTLTYVNAGHNPPMLFRPRKTLARSLGAEAARAESSGACEVLRLASTGMVLGVDCDASYRRAVVSMEPGDLLVLFTDGVTEATNPEHEDYGEEALQTLVQNALNLPPEKIMNLIIRDVRRHAGGAQQADDITLIVASVDGD